MSTRTRRAPKLPAALPDVRDGLTRSERVVLVTLNRLQAEKGGRSVSVMELYGHVVEQLDLSQHELQRIISRLVGRAGGGHASAGSAYEGGNRRSPHRKDPP